MSTIKYTPSNQLSYGINNVVLLDPIVPERQFGPSVNGISKAITFNLVKASDLVKIHPHTGVIMQLAEQLPDTFQPTKIQVAFQIDGDANHYSVDVQLEKGLYYGYEDNLDFTGDANVDHFVPNLSPKEAANYNWKLEGSSNFEINGQGRIELKAGVSILTLQACELSITATNKADASKVLQTKLHAFSMVAFNRQYQKSDDFFLPGFGNLDPDTKEYDDELHIKAQGSGQSFAAILGNYGMQCDGVNGLPYFLELSKADGQLKQVLPIPANFRACHFKVHFKATYGVVIREVSLLLDDANFRAAYHLFHGIPAIGDTSFGSLMINELLINIEYALKELPEKSKSGLDSQYFLELFFPDAEASVAIVQDIRNGIPKFAQYRGLPEKQLNWSQMARLLVLQAIAYQTSAGLTLDHDRIYDDLNLLNEELNVYLVNIYAVVYLNNQPEKIQRLLDSHASNNSAIREEYWSLLNGDYSAKIVAGNPDGVSPLQLFHHWTALIGLDQSKCGSPLANEIQTFLHNTHLDQKEVFDVVNSTNYFNYYAFSPNQRKAFYTINKTLHSTQETIRYEDVIEDLSSVIHAVTAATEEGEYRTLQVHEASAQSFVNIFGKDYLNQGIGGFSDHITTLGKTPSAPNTAIYRLENLQSSKASDHLTITGIEEMTPFAGLITSKRQTKTLYSIDSSDLKFSTAQLFVNGKHKEAGQPYFLTLAPHTINTWMPGIRDLGVGELKEGAVLLNSENSTITIQKIHRHDISDPTESKAPLYDLLLHPKSVGEAVYFCGGQSDGMGEMYAVGPQLPLLSTYGYANQVLMALMERVAGVVQAKRASFEGMSETELMELMGTLEMGDTLEEVIQLAFEADIEKTVSLKNHQAIAALGLLGQFNVDFEDLPTVDEQRAAFLQLLYTDADQLKLDQSLITVYEFLQARYAREFATMVELGWRVFPMTNDPTQYLSVSVGDLVLDGDHAMSQNKNAQVQILLSTEKGTLFESIPATTQANRQPTAYVIHHDAVAYFDARLNGDDYQENRTRLTFRFDLTINGESTKLIADSYLPCPLSSDLRQMNVSIREEKTHKVCGRLFFDLRLLTPIDYKEELQNKAEWTPDQRGAYAQMLGVAWGESMVQLLTGEQLDWEELYLEGTAYLG